MLLGRLQGLFGEFLDLEQQSLEFAVELLLLDFDLLRGLVGLLYFAALDQLDHVLDVLFVIGVLALDLLQGRQDVLELLFGFRGVGMFHGALGQLLGLQDLFVHLLGQFLEGDDEGQGDSCLACGKAS